MKLVLHSDDINLLSYWQQSISDEYVIVDDFQELHQFQNAILLFNFSSCDSACEKVLEGFVVKGNRVLVLHRVPSFETAKKLLQAGAMGYGNALMKEHFLKAALNTIREGMVWLYPEFTLELIKNMGSSQQDNDDLLEKLTQREKEVALLLKEGHSYNHIAESLSITPRTVKAHAIKCYTKLDVHDRMGLALLFK